LQAFNKQVNAAIVDLGFIIYVRKKLDLGQREAAAGAAVIRRNWKNALKPQFILCQIKCHTKTRISASL
jgi:hypothetical protein